MQMFRISKILASHKDASHAAITKEISCKDVAEVGVQELCEEDIIVAAMGATGAGMTTFVSRVTGRDEGIGHSLGSRTTEIKAFRVPFLSGALRLVLIDAPGFNNSDKSDVDILKQISDWLQPAYNKGLRLSGLLYFYRMSDNRMSGTALSHLKLFKKLCGQNDVYQKICLVTTMWQEVDKSTGEEREDELRKSYWKAMLSCGAHIQRFQNSPESAQAILNKVLSYEMNIRATRIHKQLQDSRKKLPSPQTHTEPSTEQPWASIKPEDLTLEKLAELCAQAQASRQLAKTEQSESNCFAKLFRMLHT